MAQTSAGNAGRNLYVPIRYNVEHKSSISRGQGAILETGRVIAGDASELLTRLTISGALHCKTRLYGEEQHYDFGDGLKLNNRCGSELTGLDLGPSKQPHGLSSEERQTILVSDRHVLSGCEDGHFAYPPIHVSHIAPDHTGKHSTDSCQYFATVRVATVDGLTIPANNALMHDKLEKGDKLNYGKVFFYFIATVPGLRKGQRAELEIQIYMSQDKEGDLALVGSCLTEPILVY
ncbi:hypothetical protein F66182_4289 [Fusarium sp. NRRL 66182]|nr:hypothetical protein F66182_4289 [Fusarium sp. NRRL 66182]